MAERKLSEQGRSKEFWQLVGLERDLGEQLALLDVRDQADHQLRRTADGAVFRRLATSVLEPTRLERAVPLSSFAAAALPDPDRLHGRDWVEEVYACPADVISLSGGLEGNLRLLQIAGDELQILAALTGKKSRDTRYFKSVYQPALAAVDTQTTAEGKEFVPTGLSGRWLERLGAAVALVELFEVVPMPSASYKLPSFAVRPGRPSRHPEQTADTGQTAITRVTPGTAAVALTASKIAVSALVSGEATEDMLVPLIGAIEAELGAWLAAGADDAIINGDVSGPHMDSDVTAASDVRKAWNGLRKLCPAAARTDGANTTLTAAMLRANRKKLGRAGSIAGQLAHIVSPVGAEQLASDTAVVTLERYGPQVVPLLDEVGRIDGVPVIVSDYVREDLNAAGVYDGTTANRAIALTVNRGGFVVGQRRSVTITTSDELLAEADQRAIIATLRLAFAATQPAGNEAVALTFNLSTG